MFDWNRQVPAHVKELAIRDAISSLEAQLSKLEANDCLLSAASVSHALDSLRSELKHVAG